MREDRAGIISYIYVGYPSAFGMEGFLGGGRLQEQTTQHPASGYITNDRMFNYEAHKFIYMCKELRLHT